MSEANAIGGGDGQPMPGVSVLDDEVSSVLEVDVKDVSLDPAMVSEIDDVAGDDVAVVDVDVVASIRAASAPLHAAATPIAIMHAWRLGIAQRSYQPRELAAHDGLREASRWTNLAKSMSGPVNIHDAKTNLSKLLERVERGEEIVIARAGKPIARLCPMPTRTRRRRLGKYEGKIVIAADFDALPDDIAAALGILP